MSDKKQKKCVKCFHLVTDDGLYERKAFYTINIVFYSSSNSGNIIDFPKYDNSSAPFKFKQKIKGQTGSGRAKDVEIIVPLKYRSNFRRTLEMSLIKCEIIL